MSVLWFSDTSLLVTKSMLPPFPSETAERKEGLFLWKSARLQGTVRGLHVVSDPRKFKDTLASC